MNDVMIPGDESSISGRLVELVRKMPLNDQKALLKRLEESVYKGQRKHLRKRFFMVIDFNTKLGRHEDFIKNISAGGAFIETWFGFSIGDEIALNFPLPHCRENINVTGKVVRTTQEGIGIRFKTLTRRQERMIKSLLEIL